jgi:uncharacterized membrane protein YagU involved in acid resistance
MNEPQSPNTDENLRLLSMFHYIWAAMGILGLGFLALHYGMMSTMMDPEVMARDGKPPPQDMLRFMGMFKWFYVGFALYGITTMVLNVLAAQWIRARTHWMFCVVVAAINCISMPLGTVLGAFTLVLLTKPAVRASFR